MPHRMESRATENGLFEAIVGIAAHDQEARLDVLCRGEERVAHRFMGSRDDPPLCIKAVPRKDFDKSLRISGVFIKFLDREHLYILGILKKCACCVDGVDRLDTRIPRNGYALQREDYRAIRNKQQRTSRLQKRTLEHIWKQAVIVCKRPGKNRNIAKLCRFGHLARRASNDLNPVGTGSVQVARALRFRNAMLLASGIELPTRPICSLLSRCFNVLSILLFDLFVMVTPDSQVRTRFLGIGTHEANLEMGLQAFTNRNRCGERRPIVWAAK